MPRAINPYHAPAGQYEPIGQGVNNLASMFLQVPSAGENASAEAMAWRARESREGVHDMERARRGQRGLADLFENYDPTTFDPREVMGTALRNNVYDDPSKLASLFLVASGNLPGMTDDQRVGALVGTGRPMSSTTSVSREHQTDLMENAARLDRENRLALAENERRTPPLSRDALVAWTAANQGNDAAADLRQALFGNTASSGNPLLDATRRSDLEADIDETVNMLAADLGLEPGQVPPALRTRILREGMTRVMQGENPRGAVGDLFQRYGVAVDDPWWRGPRISYDEGAVGQTAQPAQPAQPAGAPVPGKTVYRDPESGAQYLFKGGNPNDPNAWTPVSS